MLGWLWRTLVGRFSACSHKWEQLSNYNIRSSNEKTIVGTMYVLRCKECGNIKQVTIGL